MRNPLVWCVVSVILTSMPLDAKAGGGGRVHVSGYFRRDGTYVREHTRSYPNQSGIYSGTIYWNNNPYGMVIRPGFIPGFVPLPASGSIQTQMHKAEPAEVKVEKKVQFKGKLLHPLFAHHRYRFELIWDSAVKEAPLTTEMRLQLTSILQEFHDELATYGREWSLAELVEVKNQLGELKAAAEAMMTGRAVISSK